ncbi:hypothetical protein [Streptosporangium sp. NPDC000396]
MCTIAAGPTTVLGVRKPVNGGRSGPDGGGLPPTTTTPYFC